MEKIDKLDRQILNIISKNARIPFKDVAEECGVSRNTTFFGYILERNPGIL